MPRVVFVTGASRGIGRGIAERFLREGFRVAVGYREQRAAAEQVASGQPNGLAVRVDVEDRASVQQAIAATRDHFGSDIAILVNNAAIAQEKPFLTITDADWDRMLATNLRGPFVVAQEVLPAMLREGWGRIINVSSIGGQWGGLNQVHYAAAKAGLINLTRSLAKLFSSKGITSNAIAPGLVATDMSAAEMDTAAGKAKVQGIPAGRTGTVDEIASAAFFLASNEASYVTGQTLNLNGGMYFG